MRIIILSLLLFLSLSATAQNTWVRKLAYPWDYLGYNYITGIKQIETGPDGSIYVLATITVKYTTLLYKFYPNSNQLEWTIGAGFYGLGNFHWSDRFMPTADSGVVLCFNTRYTNPPVYRQVIKVSKDGLNEWSKSFYANQMAYIDNPANDVMEISPGRYYMLSIDSMFTLNDGGNIIDSTGAVSGQRFLTTNNGDLLVLTTANNLIRTDTLGNVAWTFPCSGAFAYDTSSVFISNGNTYVRKVDALTGITLWNKDYAHAPISEIEATHDGGFIASVGYRPYGIPNLTGVNSPGFLIRADSLGDTLWTRTYPLPYYGLPTFRTIPGGNILTGGSYQIGSPDIINKERSAFLCMMNSDGSYPLGQTDYVCPGDPNQDHFRFFTDDALETMLGIGQTGTPRDSSLDGWTGRLGLGNRCEWTDIAIDWPNSSPSGFNFKFHDFDGNGVVDTNDVYELSECNKDSLPLYYRYGHTVQTQNNEVFSMVPVNDTIQPGQEALYYMILGTGGNPVDSIYGFAFIHCIDEYGYYTYVNSTDFYNTSLGMRGSNLFAYESWANVGQTGIRRERTIMCRMDFQNATGVFDTVGVLHYDGLYSNSIITPIIIDFKAILWDGTEISFNVNVGSIYIDSSAVFVSSINKNNMVVFPNPANESLVISSEFGVTAAKISIFNAVGEKVKEINSSGTVSEISVADLPNGFYTGTVSSAASLRNFSFVVQH